jgi:hypothetical protein
MGKTLRICSLRAQYESVSIINADHAGFAGEPGPTGGRQWEPVGNFPPRFDQNGRGAVADKDNRRGCDDLPLGLGIEGQPGVVSVRPGPVPAGGQRPYRYILTNFAPIGYGTVYLKSFADRVVGTPAAGKNMPLVARITVHQIAERFQQNRLNGNAQFRLPHGDNGRDVGLTSLYPAV